MENIEREISESGDYIKITYIVNGYRMHNSEIATWLKDAYKIPEREIKEKILKIGKELIEKYNVDNEDLKEALENEGEFYNIWISKSNKTAKELKEEIKTINRIVEELIVRAIEEAKKIRERIDVSDWIWKKALFNWNKKRFIPVKESSDDC